MWSSLLCQVNNNSIRPKNSEKVLVIRLLINRGYERGLKIIHNHWYIQD